MLAATYCHIMPNLNAMSIKSVKLKAT